MNHRYRVQYNLYHPSQGYIVVDQLYNRTVFTAASKSATIARAQKLNGFVPVDGDEQTYGQQVKQGDCK